MDAAVAKQTYYRECDRYFQLNFLDVRQAVCVCVCDAETEITKPMNREKRRF